MQVTAKSRKQLQIANLSFVALFLATIGLLQWLSAEYHVQFDLTQNSRHTLSEASKVVLETLDKPLTITAYASTTSGQHKPITDLINRYKQQKPNITLEFVDPNMEPQRIREDNIQVDGEILLRYGDARETVTQLSEESFTNALTRLGHRGERWLVFLSGHGERSPDSQRNFDLSIWASQLRKRGFNTRTLQLADTPQIPKNTTALVIAGARVPLLPGEIKAIMGYVKAGGNLLWLADPGPRQGLDTLAEFLGIEFHPGMIIDPNSQTITHNASAVLVANYNNHTIVKNFSELSLFPEAVGLQYKDSDEWKRSGFLDTRESAWTEIGELKGKVEFNKGSDISGPITLGVTLTRELENKAEQRVVIVGDGDFLSDSFIGNGGNIDLGLSILNWVSQDDAYVSIPVRTAVDQGLTLSRAMQATIMTVFMLFFPLSLIGSGIGIWLKRRKR